MKMTREILLELLNNKRQAYVNVPPAQAMLRYESIRKLVMLGAILLALLVFGRVAARNLPVQGVKRVAVETSEVGKTESPALAGASAGGASVLVVDSPGTNLEAAELGMLAKAKRSLDVAMDDFSDMDLARELVKLKAGGVVVRVYLGDVQHSANAASALPVLLAGGVDVRMKGGKFGTGLASYAIDNSVLRTGASQWSVAELKNEDADGEVIYLESPVVVRRFEDKFEALWNRDDNVMPR
jgi:hypothetical protein